MNTYHWPNASLLETKQEVLGRHDHDNLPGVLYLCLQITWKVTCIVVPRDSELNACVQSYQAKCTETHTKRRDEVEPPSHTGE